MKLTRLVVGLFGVTYIAGTLAHPYIDGDLFWQRWLGEIILRTHEIPRTLGLETFAAVGAPWTPQEWLFSLLFAIASRMHAAWFFEMAVGVCVAMTLALVALRASRRASPVATTIALIVCGVALDPSLGVRAQDVGWLFFAAFLVLLDSTDTNVYWAIPLVALWSNVHASAMLALPIIIIDLFVAVMSQDGSMFRRGAVLLGVCAALCANPFGLGLPLYAFHLSGSPIRTYIVEWQAFAWTQPSWYAVFVPTMLIFGLRFRAVLAQPRELLRVILLAIMSCIALRNIALFAILAAPLLATTLDPWCRIWSERLASLILPDARMVGVMSALLLAIVFAGSYWASYVPLGGRLPFAALSILQRVSGEKRLFCSDFAWCSLALGRPDTRVYLDGRADPFPWAAWRRYLRIDRGGEAALRELEQIHATAVLATPESPLDRQLLHSSVWRRIYGDSLSELFVVRRSIIHVSPAATRNPT